VSSLALPVFVDVRVCRWGWRYVVNVDWCRQWWKFDTTSVNVMVISGLLPRMLMN